MELPKIRKLRLPKILICGHGRHGKDTVAEILELHFGFRYSSSSNWCSEHVVFPKLKHKYNYVTIEQCYEDRVNHRSEWFDIISEYNSPDRTTLGRAILAEGDIYVGLRNKAEMWALRNTRVFDISIWIDALDRLPPEDESSMTIEPWMCDFWIDNNGSPDELTFNTVSWGNTLLGRDIEKVNLEMK